MIDARTEPHSEPAPLTARRPHLTIKPTSGWQAINVAELWQFRDLLTTLAQRDVKLRYRQTALGAIWVVLQPLMAAIIFTVVFSRIAHLPTDGLPALAFMFASLLAWNAFSSTLGKVSGCLLANGNLVSKVYFPRLVLPMSTVLSTLLDFAVSLVMMVVLMVVYHIIPGFGLLLLPLWLALIVLMAVGIGLFTSALMVTYRDVGYILPVIVNFLLYASPIAYSLAVVPAHLHLLFTLNPLSGLLQAFRWSLLNDGTLPLGMVAYSAAFSVIVFVAGAFSFKKMERKFADVI